MKKSILAILDKEKEYGNRFMAYVNQMREEQFLVLAFSNLESFLSCAKEEKVEILLVSEEIIAEFAETFAEIFAVQIILLREGGNIREGEEYPSVYKFQSAQEILEEIKVVYKPKERYPISNRLETVKEKNVIAIYAAAGGSKKTCFSLGLVQILAEERKCIYLGFDLFSGILEGEEGSEKGMSELIYYLKQPEVNPFAKSREARKSMHGFDCYLTPNRPLDLMELETADCRHLLHAMREESDYDTMVLDIGILNSAMVTLLEGCDMFYYPLNRSPVDERKLKEFRRFLKLEEREDILEKMITITIPEDEKLRENFEIEDLATGTMGSFIESVLPR